MIIIEIDGIQYSGLLSAYVKRSIEELSGKFEIEIAPNDPLLVPLKIGKFCKIFVDGKQYVSGYVEALWSRSSVNSYTAQFSGRDITGDIIDSSFLVKKDFSANTNFKNVILESLKLLNLKDKISVIVNKGVDVIFKDGEIISAEQGDNYFDFFRKYAVKKNTLLTTDGLGNILLTRASDKLSGINLFRSKDVDNNYNNILESQLNIDESNRFGIYQAHSQLGFDQIFEDSDFTNSSGKVVDKEIRNSRQMSVNIGSATEDDAAKKCALWEKNQRKSTAYSYMVSVPLFSSFETGQVWEPNMLIKVVDSTHMININSELLIKEVEFNYSVNGSTTNLTLVDPIAYTLLEDPKQSSTKKSKSSILFEV